MCNKIDLLSLCIVSKGAKEQKGACLEFGSLECKLATPAKTRFASNVAMFPIVAYLARGILGKLGSQIETKKIISIVGILTSLCHCRLGPKDLDFLVFLIKNRHDDPIGFEAKKGPQDVDEFGEVEEEILDLLDAKFPNEVEGHVEKCAELGHVSMISVVFCSFYTWNFFCFD